jgi:bacillithiol biosynthesis cysteine-adding enzyme BshC
MDFSTEFIDYNLTGFFSKMAVDYISGNSSLQPFYNYPVSIEGVKAAINSRKNFHTDRALLVSVLEQQYKTVKLTDKQQTNLQQLKEANTFTICTAHQPNIFTGPLFFIYKILHVIKIAADLEKQLPENKFVPVYYMGSEDADLDELGYININGIQHKWNTNQTGAVGRMKVDKAFMQLMGEVERQLAVYPSGNEIIGIIRNCYKENSTIEQATFQFVNELFAEYGLIVLLPDNAALKRKFIPVIEKELNEGFSHTAVEATMKNFPSEYKVQATGREINLFYLKEDKRERIESTDDSGYKVQGKRYKADEFLNELQEHPEYISPNVILRPVFQELILPNIVFVGGGGELAYWLELKKVFEAVSVPYPMLVLRNSFINVCKDRLKQAEELKFNITDLFKKELDLINELVQRDSKVQLSLKKEKQQLTELYQQLKNISGAVDNTLQQHTEALRTQALKKIEALEKKMLRAEKKKFEAQQRHLHKLKTQLFPGDSLQERVDNIMVYYAKYGKGFIRKIYDNSLAFEQKFTILKEEKGCD